MIAPMMLLRWVLLIAFVWTTYRLNWTAMLVIGAILLLLLVRDWITQPGLLKDAAYGLIGAILGAMICWTTGFAILSFRNYPEAEYVGPGLEPWNLPGTLLGMAAWIGITLFGLRKNRRTSRFFWFP